MQRILLIGSPGPGKSTLARALRRYGRHARIVRLRSDEGIVRFVSGL